MIISTDNQMIIWSCSHVLLWSYYHMIIWSYYHTIKWSYGHSMLERYSTMFERYSAIFKRYSNDIRHHYNDIRRYSTPLNIRPKWNAIPCKVKQFPMSGYFMDGLLSKHRRCVATSGSPSCVKCCARCQFCNTQLNDLSHVVRMSANLTKPGELVEQKQVNGHIHKTLHTQSKTHTICMCAHLYI